MELSFDELTLLMRDYVQANRSIPIYDVQERQGNSKLWEKDLEDYLRYRGFDFKRNNSLSPDFGEPLNVDVKTIRFDRKTKTFSIAPLSVEEAVSGVLPYRMVVLIWKYDAGTQRGYAVDAIMVPKEAKTVLTNWSFKGIQVKSGVSEALIRKSGILAGQKLGT